MDKLDKYIKESVDRQLGVFLGEAKKQKLTGKDKKAYEEFFTSMLDKYGVKSPADIPKNKKQQFFDEVDAGWKAKHEK